MLMQSESGVCFDFLRAKDKLEALKYTVTLEEGTFVVQKRFTDRKFVQRCRTASELRILADAIDQFYTPNPNQEDFIEPSEKEIRELPKAIQIATFLLDEGASFVVRRSLPNLPVSWVFTVHARDKEILKKAVM